MTLEKISYIDSVEVRVLDRIVVQVREVTNVKEDGNIISTNYKRWVVEPGDDLSVQPPLVQTVCNAVFP